MMYEDWSERMIGRALAFQVFMRKNLVIVPNCNFTGHEADILVVTPQMKLIDIEIKISRADLKHDQVKEKWWHCWDSRIDGPRGVDWKPEMRRQREWPPRIWKHYVAMPRDIWVSELSGYIKKGSGVLLIQRNINKYHHSPTYYIDLIKRATPNKLAKPVTAENAINLARLASLRMWNAYEELEDMKHARST